MLSTTLLVKYVLLIFSSISLIFEEKIVKPLISNPFSFETEKLVASNSDSIDLALLFCKLLIPPISELILIDVPVLAFKLLNPPPNL